VQQQKADGLVKNPLSVLTSVASITLAPSLSSSAATDEPDDRAYMARPVDDIDARDSENPLLCTEYVNQMYALFREAEKKPSFLPVPTYMERQTLVNEKMRTILVDWLVEVHLKFKMVPESLYLSINILDRYLGKVLVRRSRLQLVGVASLLLASKYEEIYPPELRDLVYVTDRAYTKEEIVETEADITLKLMYEFVVPTTHTFLCRFLKAAHADRQMVQLACFLAERTLQEYTMLEFPPSIVAASSVMLSRKTLKRHPWSPTLLKYTTYDEPQLVRCMDAMRNLFNAPNQQQNAVERKYSSPKFGGVSSIKVDF